MKKLIIFFTFFISFSAFSQVGIGTATPDASAKLDVTSTNKGFLPPRIALTGTNDVSTITSPATGLLVYNTATAGTAPNNVVPGYYYNSGTPSSPVWQQIMTPNSVIVNGTTQQTANFNISGTGKIGGDATINGLTIGKGKGSISTNTAMGINALYSNTSGSYNTASGNSALFSNTSGYYNTGIGSGSLASVSNGYDNTAVGEGSLQSVTSGYGNTAIGYLADVGNGIIGNLFNSTAIGYNASTTTSNTIQLGNNQISSVNTSGKLTTGAVTYPNTDGASGQVLTTNGSGTLSWTNIYTSGTIHPGYDVNYGFQNPSYGGNFTLSSSNTMNYMKIGNMVFFNGIIGQFTQSSNTYSSFDFALPIASSFVSTTDAMGTVTSYNSTYTGVSGQVSANTSNNHLVISFITTASSCTNMFISFSGSYIIH